MLSEKSITLTTSRKWLDLVIIKFFNTTKQKRQLAYAYEYKANLLSQAKEANVQPSPIEYEFACENIGYELGFVCGFISAMKK